MFLNSVAGRLSHFTLTVKHQICYTVNCSEIFFRADADLAGDGRRRVSRGVEGGDDRSSQRGLSRRAGLAAAHLPS